MRYARRDVDNEASEKYFVVVLSPSWALIRFVVLHWDDSKQLISIIVINAEWRSAY